MLRNLSCFSINVHGSLHAQVDLVWSCLQRPCGRTRQYGPHLDRRLTDYPNEKGLRECNIVASASIVEYDGRLTGNCGEYFHATAVRYTPERVNCVQAALASS